jgi:hypothetical protein
MSLFGMAVTMALPMAAWMRYRGHAWRPNIEMVASMLIPTFVVMALLATHIARSGGPVMVVEHGAMLAAMLIAMLVRRDEYTAAH